MYEKGGYDLNCDLKEIKINYGLTSVPVTVRGSVGF